MSVPGSLGESRSGATPAIQGGSFSPIPPTLTAATVLPVRSSMLRTDDSRSTSRETIDTALTAPEVQQYTPTVAKDRPGMGHPQRPFNPFLAWDSLERKYQSRTKRKSDADQFQDSASACGSDVTVSQLSTVLNALNINKYNMTTEQLSVVFEAIGMDKDNMTAADLSTVFTALGFGKSGSVVGGSGTLTPTSQWSGTT